jgi:CheY-like chemotaxis protein
MSGEREIVLVVEDNAMVRQVSVGLLELLGFQVLEAENGPRALEILQSNPGVDVLFTDIIMPGGLNGFRLAERARQAVPGLKVVFTSGYTESSLPIDEQLAEDMSMLTKPFEVSQLAAAMDKVLHRK